VNTTKDTVRSELVLRLTDAQIAAIRLRHQRREKHSPVVWDRERTSYQIGVVELEEID